MPLPKYYCDYCEIQFQDTPQARRRHLQGGQHQRARALYYNSLKGPNQIQTGVCNHFVRTGFCQYGDSCKYIHPNQNIQTPYAQLTPGMNPVEMDQLPDTIGRQPIREDFVRDDIIGNRMGFSLGNLPPSLRPPPEAIADASSKKTILYPPIESKSSSSRLDRRDSESPVRSISHEMSKFVKPPLSTKKLSLKVLGRLFRYQ